MPVTLKDIAARAGVSESMVSLVLNNKRGGRTVAGTGERIRQIATEMGYQPSVLARALAGKGTDMLGVVFSHSESVGVVATYEGMLLDGIFVAAGRARQNIVIFTRRVWDDERLHHTLSGGQCDGLLLISPFRNNKLVAPLLKAAVPLAVVSDMRPEPNVTCVDIDNAQAAYAATEYLIQQGHRRIAALHFAEYIGCSGLRLDGYLRALADNGLRHDPSIMMQGWHEDWAKDSPKGADQFLTEFRQMFRRPAAERPTAILSFDDQSALYALTLLQELGLRVPQDVSVMGMNDELCARFGHLALTTVRQPFHRIGEIATELLLDQIHRDLLPGRKEILPYEIVVRESVAPPS